MIKATQELKEWKKLAGHSNLELARLLSEGKKYHYDPNLVSAVFNGSREPSKQLMKSICKLTSFALGKCWLFDPFSEERTNGTHEKDGDS